MEQHTYERQVSGSHRVSLQLMTGVTDLLRRLISRRRGSFNIVEVERHEIFFGL